MALLRECAHCTRAAAGSKPKASRSATVCVYIADNDKQQQRPAHSQVPAMKSLDTVAGLLLQRKCHSRACGMQRMLASTASSEMLARVHDVRWHGQSKTWKHTRMILLAHISSRQDDLNSKHHCDPWSFANLQDMSQPRLDRPCNALTATSRY